MLFRVFGICCLYRREVLEWGDSGKVGLKGNGVCSLNKISFVFELWLEK